MMIEEVRVIYASRFGDLSEKVNTMIKNGWQPLGTVEVLPPWMPYSPINCFMTMVKYQDPPKVG